MKYSFTQFESFVTEWRRLKLTDEDLQALEEMIISRPEAGVVMKGTGGLRKVRFAPPSWNRGKSGATRVCYVLISEASHCCFLEIFAKNEQPNLSPKSREEIRKLVD